MRKILAVMILAATPSLAQEADDGTKVINVALPMLCGEYKALRKVLDDGEYKDLSIGTDQITKGTLITIAYNADKKTSVIGQWSEDMSYGCLAYVVGESKFVKNVDDILKPKPNL